MVEGKDGNGNAFLYVGSDFVIFLLLSVSIFSMSYIFLSASSMLFFTPLSDFVIFLCLASSFVSFSFSLSYGLSLIIFIFVITLIFIISILSSLLYLSPSIVGSSYALPPRLVYDPAAFWQRLHQGAQFSSVPPIHYHRRPGLERQ